MSGRAALSGLSIAVALAAAWAGHELPVYPSFYPHEIEIRTLAPQQAAAALRQARVHAYLGTGLGFAGAPPEPIRAVESLGALVVVRVNRESPLGRDEGSVCAAVEQVMRALTEPEGDFVFHPYPVTPFDGDYLYHLDLAEAAKARVAAGASDRLPTGGELRVKASRDFVRRHPAWSAERADWDVEIREVNAAGLVAESAHALNGLIAPPWLRTGWFRAERLLSEAVRDPAQQQRADTDFSGLTSGGYDGLTERINLERDLVAALTNGCSAAIAGYTVKRQYFNDDYSAGIENVDSDAIEGLQSPTFIRTVKLKDFPWNGWLALATDAAPDAAWNPIAGMTDPFGRLMWDAMGDPAVLPSPREAGWMLNRISDVQRNQGAGP